MKKVIALLTATVVFATTLFGCGSNGGNQDKGTANSGTEQESAKKGNYKIALLLPGSISEMSWSAPAYEGVKKLADEIGAELSYTENVAASDYESVMRGYASEGYDCIYAHGSQFADAANLVASDFPDVKFVITNATEGNGKNLSGVLMNNYEMGFLAGCITGLMTKSGKVASVVGEEIQPLREGADGVKAGVAYVNPDVEVEETVTGSSTDPNVVSEATITLIDGGCDIVTVYADAASVGAITASGEKGVKCIATASADFATEYPDIVPCVSALNITETVYNASKMAYEGKLEPKSYTFGIAEGTVDVTEMSADIPSDVQQKVTEILEKIKSGEIDTESLRIK